MALTPVTDPDLLAQLESGGTPAAPTLTPVGDPSLLARLEPDNEDYVRARNTNVRGDLYSELTKNERMTAPSLRAFSDPQAGTAGQLAKGATEGVGARMGESIRRAGALFGMGEMTTERGVFDDILAQDDLRKVGKPFEAKEPSKFGELLGQASTLGLYPTPQRALKAEADKRGIVANELVPYFEKQGITDGKEMMTLLRDAVRENQWDSTSPDAARRMSDGSLAFNPNLVALPDANEGLTAIENAKNVPEGEREKALNQFKRKRAFFAQSMDEKTREYDDDYAEHAQRMEAAGITDPEEIFYSWPKLDRNWIEGSWDLVRDTVASSGRNMANIGRSAVAGVAEKLGAEGVAASAAESIVASQAKQQFVSQIAAAQGRGGVGETVQTVGTTVLDMIPMFAGAGGGRFLASKGYQMMGKITAGTSVYGYAGLQGYASAVQTAIGEVEAKAREMGRAATEDELVKAVDGAQWAGILNGVQTGLLARLLNKGAESTAMQGITQQASVITGRQVLGLARKEFGEGGIRAALQATKPEAMKFVKQTLVAAGEGASDELVEEYTNQLFEGLIIKYSGIQGEKTLSEIGMDSAKGGALGAVVGGGLPAAFRTFGRPSPAEHAANELAAKAQNEGAEQAGAAALEVGAPMTTETPETGVSTVGETAPTTETVQTPAGEPDQSPMGAPTDETVTDGGVAAETVMAPTETVTEGEVAAETVTEPTTETGQVTPETGQAPETPTPETPVEATLPEPPVSEEAPETAPVAETTVTEPSPQPEAAPTAPLPEGTAPPETGGAEVAPVAEVDRITTSLIEDLDSGTPQFGPEAETQYTQIGASIDPDVRLGDQRDLGLFYVMYRRGELTAEEFNKQHDEYRNQLENLRGTRPAFRAGRVEGPPTDEVVPAAAPEGVAEGRTAEEGRPTEEAPAGDQQTDTIFGYSLDAILSAQQGGKLSSTVPARTHAENAEKILSDVERFKIPVSVEVLETYGLSLPEGYVRQGDLYVFQPTQPRTQQTDEVRQEQGQQVSPEAGQQEVRPQGLQGGETEVRPQGQEVAPETPVPDEGAGAVAPYTVDGLKQTFDLTDEQATVADAIGKALGAQVGGLAKGGKPGDGALRQGGLTSEQAARHAELEAKHNAGTITPEETAEAERLVEGAAKSSGYEGKAYHGTPSGGFTEFRPRDGQAGIFFTDKRDIADSYTMHRGMWLSKGKNPEVMSVFLAYANPLEIDALGKRWDNIPFPGVPWKPKVFGNLPANAININEAVKRGFAAGHDAVIVRNVLDSTDQQDTTKSTVYAVEESGQVKSAVPFTGVPLDQRFDPTDPSILRQGPKGAMEVTETGKIVLRGLQSPDFTTAVHELAHAARRTMDALLTPEEVTTVEQWAGAEKGWTRQAEERWARGWERYFTDGKAPLQKLQAVFDKIASWMRDVYANIQNSPIDVEITPEVRAIFDKLASRMEAPTDTTAEQQLNEEVRQQLTGEWDNLTPDERYADLGQFAETWVSRSGGKAAPDTGDGGGGQAFSIGSGRQSVRVVVDSEGGTARAEALASGGIDAPSEASMDAEGNITITLTPEVLLRATRFSETELEAKRYVATVLREEVIHAAHLMAVRDSLPETGGNLSAAVNAEIKSTFDKMVLEADPETLREVLVASLRTYRGIEGLYEGMTLAEVLSRTNEAARITALGEMARRTVQMRRGETPTEATRPDWVEKVKTWMQQSLGILRGLAANPSVLGHSYAAEIARIETTLAVLEGQDIDQTPTQTSEQQLNEEVRQQLTGEWDGKNQSQKALDLGEFVRARISGNPGYRESVDPATGGKTASLDFGGRRVGVSYDSTPGVKSEAKIDPDTGDISIIIGDSSLFAIAAANEAELPSKVRAARMADEEIIHAAHLLSLRERVGKQDDYEAAVAEEAASVLRNMVDSAKSDFDRAAIEDTVKASIGVYHGLRPSEPEFQGKSADTLLNELDTPQQAAVLGEAVRQVVQLRKDGGITESSFVEFSKRVIGWFKGYLDILKSLATDTAKFGPRFAQEVADTEAVLAELEGQDIGQTPPETPPTDKIPTEPPPLPAEAAPTDEFTLGIKKAKLNEARARLGLKPLDPNKFKGDEKLLAQAFDELARDPQVAVNRAKQTAAEAKKGKEYVTNYSPQEVATANLYHAQEQVEIEKLKEQWQAANLAGDKTRADTLNQEIDRRLIDLDAWERNLHIATSSAGAAFRELQPELQEDYSFAGLSRTYQTKIKKDGTPLTPEETAKIAAAADTFRKEASTLNLMSLADSMAEAGMEAEAERLVAVAERIEEMAKAAEENLAKSRKQITAPKRAKIKKKLNTAAEAARKRLEEQGWFGGTPKPPTQGGEDVMMSGLDPQTARNIRDAATVMGAKFADKLIDGTISLQEFTVGLIETFGEKVRPFSERIYEETKKLGRKYRGEETVTEEPATIEEVLDEVDGDLDEPTRKDVTEVAKFFIADGKTGLEVMELTHAALEPMFPDLTRETVETIFTGYGTVRTPDQSPNAKELRRIKELAREKLKQYDLARNELAKLTGYQRDETDPEVRQARRKTREMQKEVEEFLRSQGIEVPSDTQRQKTGLQTLKRRMANEIAELRAALKNDTPMVTVTRNGVTMDEDATKAKKRLDVLRKLYDRTFPPAAKTHEQKVEAAIKTLDRQIAEEKKMIAAGIAKRPAGESITSPEIEARREQLAELRATRRALDPENTPLEQAKRARAAANEKLRQAIETNNLAARRRTPIDPDAELQALIDAGETLRDEISEMRKALSSPENPTAFAERTKKELATAEKRLAEVERMIEEGDIAVRNNRTPRATDPAVARVRNKIKEANKRLAAMRREAMTDEERAQRFRKNIDQRIADLQRRVREGDTSPRTKKPKPLNHPIAKQARIDYQSAVDDYNEFLLKEMEKNMTLDTKAWIAAVDGLTNLQKTLLASTDISGFGKQGLKMLVSNPHLALSNYGKNFRWSNKLANETDEAIRNDPDFDDWIESGGQYKSWRPGADATSTHELYRSRLAHKIPFVKKLIGGSEKGYVTYLNSVAFAHFKMMKSKLDKEGAATKDNLVMIADLGNMLTGTSTLRGWEKHAPALGIVFWAPKFLFSQFEAIKGVAYSALDASTGFRFGNWIDTKKGRENTRVARKLMAIEHAKMTVGYIALGALLKSIAHGLDLLDDGEDNDSVGLSLDPRSTDFMKFRWGERRIDFGGGLLQALVFGTQFITGQVKRKDGTIEDIGDMPGFGDATRGSISGRFARSKLSPLVGSMVNLTTRKNYIGEPVYIEDELIGSYIPLPIQEYYEAIRSSGFAEATIATILSAHGFTSSQYGPKTDARYDSSLSKDINEAILFPVVNLALAPFGKEMRPNRYEMSPDVGPFRDK